MIARRVLLFNNALSAISNGAWYVVSPFIPLYLRTLGASDSVLGLVLGIGGIVPLLLAVPAGVLVDEHGPAAVAKAAVIAYAVAAAVLIVFHSVWAVTVAFSLLGAGNIAFAVSAQGLVASVSHPRERLDNFGYYSLWSSAGAVVGPVIGGAVAGHMGYILTFALAGLLMGPSFFVADALGAVPPPPRSVVSLANAYHLVGPILRLQGIRAVLLVSFMAVAAQTLQQSFYPIYLSHAGLSQTLIGIVFAAINVSSMLVRSLLKPGSEQLGNTGLVLVATGLAALSLGMTPFLRAFWSLAVVGAFMGAGTGLAFPLTMNLMMNPVAAELRGVAFGIRQAVQRLASVVSPIVFGALIGAYGLGSGFVVGALLLVGSMPIVAWVAGLPGRRSTGRR